MMKHIKSILTLFVICAVVSVALATVNGITAPIILDRQNQAAAGALLEVMPEGGTFEKLDLSGYSTLPATVKEAHKASNGGYVLQIEWSGFNPGNVTMVGVSADGKVTGTKTITVKDSGGNGKDSATEIPNMDANGYYVGADINTIDGVDTVGGVTVSTKAYRAAVKDALAAATILGGGSYVSPEEMFQNNLNAALGTENATFTKHFFVEVVEGVDAIYVAENNAGYVVIIGEEFIGVDVNGAVVGGVDSETNAITVSDENKATAEAAVATIKSTTDTDIDLTAFEGLSKRIVSVKVTNAGVYVIDVEGEGFGIKGEHHYMPSGKYILIRVAITSEGEIINCTTLEQYETNGLGAICGEEEYYGKFIGTTSENYVEIKDDLLGLIEGEPTIGLTTNGYMKAIENAFAAVKTFEGGAN